MYSRSLISMIITTRNEARHIENCLKSAVLQTYPNIELIVVDNASSDNTREIARKYTDLVFEKGPERSVQRNFGMLEKASGEYLLFLDADMILAPNLVADAVKMLENDPELVALYIPEIVMGQGFASQIRRFERGFYDATAIDCFRFVRKQAFLKTGGFDLALTGPEDWDLDKRIRQIGKIALLKAGGERSKSNKSAQKWQEEFAGFLRERGVIWTEYGSVIFHNEADFDLRRYLQKKAYYSTSFDTYINKWGRDDPDIQKQFGPYYRLIGVFVEDGKWKRLLQHPVLTTGMYGLRFMVGLNYLIGKIRR